jgi:hypothetical protein
MMKREVVAVDIVVAELGEHRGVELGRIFVEGAVAA